MSEPRRPLANIPDHELASLLRDLGRHLSYPATPDLASRVCAEIEHSAKPSSVFGARRRRRLLWLAAALLALVLGALALSPATRTTIADRLGLPGVMIEWVGEATTTVPKMSGDQLALGRRVTLEEARHAVEFPIATSPIGRFGEPPEIYVSGRGDTAMISFVYPTQPGLPETEIRGIGALLTQFPGGIELEIIRKGLGEALDDGETTIEAVTVGDEAGFWIAGDPHGVFLACLDDGGCREERYRLAGNVLLWERNGLTLRFESSLSRDEALDFAASLGELAGGNLEGV